MAQHTDPVCGMQIEEAEAAGQTEHDGRTYYFCSTACKDRFEASPEEYTDQ
jgi:YHS domain-containing protein